MKVAAIVKLNNGCDFYRIVMPTQYMPWQEGDYLKLFYDDRVSIPEEEKEFAANLSEVDSFTPDIIFFNRTIETKDATWLKEQKDKGVIIIMDIDDYWELDSKNYLKPYWDQMRMGDKIVANLKVANLVITTNEQLFNQVRKINLNCIVCPNAVPFGSEFYKPLESDFKSETDRKMNFLYAGGATHANDLSILKNKFERIGGDTWIQERARFILAGYNPVKKDGVHCEWDKMVSIFKRTKSYEILDTKPIEEHMLFYDIADVVLAPLLRSTFNECKSELKILEASTREIPVIASRVLPFTVLEAYDIMWDDWYTNIKWCVKNPEAAKDMGRKLSEQMKQTHDIKPWSTVRYQVFSHILKNSNSVK